jgi:hypothetical protein
MTKKELKVYEELVDNSRNNKQFTEHSIIHMSVTGVAPKDIARELKVKVSKVYYILAEYKKKNPQARAHITMRIRKMGIDNVSRDGDKITKKVTTTKVLTYGVHSIILDDNHPRKIYLQANGDIHVE